MTSENRDPCGLSRRRLAIAGSAILGSAILGSAIFGIGARPAPHPAAAQSTSDPTAGIQGFMALSGVLTNRADLDAGIGARLYAALDADDGDFGWQAQALAAYAQAHAPMGVAALATALDVQNRPLAEVLHRIVGAWYLGTVGAGSAARAIVHERALMYDSVRDALAPPSHCGGAPGYWTAKPPSV